MPVSFLGVVIFAELLFIIQCERNDRMAGVRDVKGSTVRILADNPVVGPTVAYVFGSSLANTSTAGNFVKYGDTSASLLQDSGISTTNSVTSLGTGVSHDIAMYAPPGGTVIEDSGVPKSTLVTASSGTTGNLTSFTSGTGVFKIQDTGIPSTTVAQLNTNVSFSEVDISTAFATVLSRISPANGNYLFDDLQGSLVTINADSGLGLPFLWGNPTNSGISIMRLDVNGNLSLAGTFLTLRTSFTPSSSSAAGATGTIAWDTSYLYVCTATNTWKRIALTTF